MTRFRSEQSWSLDGAGLNFMSRQVYAAFDSDWLSHTHIHSLANFVELELMLFSVSGCIRMKVWNRSK